MYKRLSLQFWVLYYKDVQHCNPHYFATASTTLQWMQFFAKEYFVYFPYVAQNQNCTKWMASSFFWEKQLRITLFTSLGIQLWLETIFLREIKPTKLAKLLNQAKTSLVTPWFSVKLNLLNWLNCWTKLKPVLSPRGSTDFPNNNLMQIGRMGSWVMIGHECTPTDKRALLNIQTTLLYLKTVQWNQIKEHQEVVELRRLSWTTSPKLKSMIQLSLRGSNSIFIACCPRTLDVVASLWTLLNLHKSIIDKY